MEAEANRREEDKMTMFQVSSVCHVYDKKHVSAVCAFAEHYNALSIVVKYEVKDNDYLVEAFFGSFEDFDYFNEVVSDYVSKNVENI